MAAVTEGYGNPSTDEHDRDANIEQPGTVGPNNADINPKAAECDSKEPNWTDKGILVALWLTLIAAIFAGCEAKRLADNAEIQITDGRKAAADQVRLSAENNKIALSAMINSTRAWIAPRETVFYSAPVRDKPLVLMLNYFNVGKLPALNVSVPRGSFPRLDASVIFGNEPDSSAVVGAIGRNTSCDGLTITPGNGGDTIFPFTDRPSHLIIDNIGTADKALWEGRTALVVKGCLGYITYGAPHYSQFCYILRPEADKKPPDWKFVTCPIGNEAN